jgi:hypothetical protein
LLLAFELTRFVELIDLGQAMAELLDAHAVYFVPAGYRLFATNRAFSLVSRVVNGTQQYFAAASRISATLYSSLCECDLNLDDFYGRRIIAIDDLPVESFLSIYAASAGYYLDASARLNLVLAANSPFPFQAMSFIAMPADEIRITFEGDLVGYRFKNFATTSQTVSSTARIIELNTPAKTSKRDGSTDASNLDSLLIDEEAVLSLLKGQIERSQASEAHLDRSKKSMDVLQANVKLARAKISSNVKREMSLAPAIRHQQIMEAWGNFLAAENGASLDLPASIPRGDSEFVVSAAVEAEINSTIISMTEGNPEHLTSYTETGAISYWSYDEVSVLKLKSFSPSGESDKAFADFTKVMETVGNGRGTNGLNKNLIIDVSGNGGGYVCLSYFALSYLVRDWNKASLTGDANNILFSPYDVRQSAYTDDLFAKGYWGSAQEEVSPATRKPLGPAFYTERVQRTYGPATSNYSQEFLWNLCAADVYKASAKSLVFDKILVITDGRCGSACSYFITKLRTANKVRVLSYGGKYQAPMDTSAFSGGNVHQWTPWLAEIKDESKISIDWGTPLPTTALATFNFREMYNPGDTIPRQFRRLPADWTLPYWDPLRAGSDLSNAQTKAILSQLYASALPLFDQIPSGLLGKNKSAPLIIAISIIGIILGTTLIVCIVVGCILHRKNRVHEYGEISSLDN